MTVLRQFRFVLPLIAALLLAQADAQETSLASDSTYFLKSQTSRQAPADATCWFREPTFQAFGPRTASYSCATQTGCTWCPDPGNVYFLLIGSSLLFPDFPVERDGDSFSGTLTGLYGSVGTFDITDATAVISGQYVGDVVNYTLTLTGLSEYWPNPALFDQPVEFECVFTVSDAFWVFETLVGNFESVFHVETPPENCVAFIFDETNHGTATILVANPDPPEITDSIDAGTGDKIVVKWTHPDPGNVAEYEACIGENPGDYFFCSETIPEDGSPKYAYTFDNLVEHTDYYVAVRAANDCGWSDFDEAGSVRPTVPVFLVHGFNGRALMWNDMRAWLLSDKFSYVYAVDNLEKCGVDGEQHFNVNAFRLSNYVEGKLQDIENTTDVNIPAIDAICHSMGGVIARRYNSPGQAWPQREIRYLIMLGTPNKGSEAVQNWRAWWLCPTGTAREQLRPSSMTRFNGRYPDNDNTEYYSFWGYAGLDRSCFNGKYGKLIDYPNDGIVSEASAIRASEELGGQPEYLNNVGRFWCHLDYATDNGLYTTFLKPILTGEGLPRNMTMERDTIPEIPAQIAYRIVDSLLAGQTVSDSFYVEANISMTIASFVSDSLTFFSLESPFGAIYDSTLVTPDTSAEYFADTLGIRVFYIENADSGTWQWTVDAASATTSPVEFLILATYENAILVSTSQNLEYFEPDDTLILNVIVTDSGAGLDGLTAVALPVWNDVDTSDSIPLLDDGLNSDSLADDGIYGAVITDYPDTGVVEFNLEVHGASSIGPINRYTTLYAYVVESLSCCEGIRGNVDGIGGVNIGDLTYLVDFLFFEGPPPPCEEEGNVNGIGGINIGDLTYLVDFLFFEGPPPPPCP